MINPDSDPRFALLLDDQRGPRCLLRAAHRRACSQRRVHADEFALLFYPILIAATDLDLWARMVLSFAVASRIRAYSANV